MQTPQGGPMPAHITHTQPTHLPHPSHIPHHQMSNPQAQQPSTQMNPQSHHPPAPSPVHTTNPTGQQQPLTTHRVTRRRPARPSPLRPAATHRRHYNPALPYNPALITPHPHRIYQPCTTPLTPPTITLCRWGRAGPSSR